MGTLEVADFMPGWERRYVGDRPCAVPWGRSRLRDMGQIGAGGPCCSPGGLQALYRGPLRRENRHIILSLGLTTLVQVFISQHWQSLEVQVF